MWGNLADAGDTMQSLSRSCATWAKDEQTMSIIELTPAIRTNDAMPKLLVSAREAARLLSLSERTLYSLTKAGQFPVVRVGRSVRYRVADLQAWIERMAEKETRNSA
jgi:excisionase family DNA binding protein